MWCVCLFLKKSKLKNNKKITKKPKFLEMPTKKERHKSGNNDRNRDNNAIVDVGFDQSDFEFHNN